MFDYSEVPRKRIVFFPLLSPQCYVLLKIILLGWSERVICLGGDPRGTSVVAAGSGEGEGGQEGGGQELRLRAVLRETIVLVSSSSSEAPWRCR